MSAAELLSAKIVAVLALLPDFGDDLHDVEVNRVHVDEPSSRLSTDVQVSVFADGERCEQLAAEILDAHPGVTLERLGGPFAITCNGDTSWSVYFSSSVCVRVQTGTRTVTEPDPEAVAALPTITREEPVYEWRCADPLAEMVGGAA